MSFLRKAHLAEALGQNGGTSSPRNTLGADLIVIGVVSYVGGAAPGVGDSESNTWVPLTRRDSTLVFTRLYYCLNPNVNAAHTFILSGSDIYATVHMSAYSGAAASLVFDVENGDNDDVGDTSISSGSTGTLAGDNELIVSIVGADSVGSAPDVSGGSLALLDAIDGGSGIFMTAMADEIQTTAAARNAAWAWTTAGRSAVAIASFKAAAGGSTTDAAINLTEAPDVLAASISVQLAAAISLTEAPDVLAASVSIQVAAAIALTEAADVLAATISTQDALTFAINVTEAPDVLAASVATSARTMTIAVTEANDIFAADIVTAAPSGASAWFVNNRRRRR